MKKIVFIPADDNNLKYAELCINSLRKFHSEEELPVVIIKDEDLQQRLAKDPNFFYRAAPILAKEFMDKGWELVIKMDADQIVTGDLSELWTGEDWDVAVVQNSNPKNLQEHQDATGQTLTVLDINPLHYVNAGLVVMRSKEFVEHWLQLCMSYHFDTFQFREQDLLNILVHYGNYRVKFLDASNKWYGLISKSLVVNTKLVKNKIILPKNDIFPQDEDKQIMCYHFAGGNDPRKGNYRTLFPSDVVKYLDQLTKA
jgi:hypothetical protein